MWKVTVLVVIAAIGLAEACLYKRAECPDYTVVEKHSDYEIRSYPPLSWAKTSVASDYRRIAEYTAFQRLFRYINGKNDREQKMAMTVPVRMQITKSNNQTICEMDFVVPAEFASNPPVPNDSTIEIVREDTTLYAVRTFNGYIWRDGKWDTEAQKLADSVKDDETVVKNIYYRVGYDAPFDLLNRRNEIWMVKKVEQETNEV